MSPPETMPAIAAATAIVSAPVTPACSKSGANARPVAGPPASVTDPARTPNSGGWPSRRATITPSTFCRTVKTVEAARNSTHEWSATPQEAQAGAESDTREERDHQRIAPRRVEGERHLPAHVADGHDQ